MGNSGLVRSVGILGAGLYVPPRVVTNAELTAALDTTEEWILSRTGIRERRCLDADLATSDMCIEAAREALADAGVEAADLDAIVVATYTPDQPLPSTAVTVKTALGAQRAISLDLTQGACAGGVYALLTAAHLLQNNTFRSVLVIGADAASRTADPRDRTLRVFLGDAAGAVVLGPTQPGFGLLSWDTGDQLSHEVGIPAGGSRIPFDTDVLAQRNHYLQMNGKAAWNIATGKLPGSIRAAAERAGVAIDDVRYFLVHQANYNIITEVAKSLDVPMGRVPVTVDRLGNTAGASIFTVLYDAVRHDAEHGDHLIVSAIGAGYIWGSLCFRHSKADR